MGTGPNAYAIESSLRYGEATVGFYHEEAVPLFSLKLGTGLTLTGATTPALVAVNTDNIAVQYATAATAATVVSYQTTIPRQFKSLVDAGDGLTGSLKARILARKVDATDENANLALRVNIIAYSQGDTAGTTLTTPIDVELAASTAAGDYSSFAWYEFDIGAALLAESKRVDGGDSLRLFIGPNETVGSADMTMQVAAVVLVYERHISYKDRTLIDA